MSLYIGSLKLNDKIMVAPMAGVTDRPFRKMIRMFSNALLFTEMISSNSIVQKQRKTFKMSEVFQDESPIAVQIVGNDPEIMAQAAKMNEDRGANIIDINMGCPVKKLISNVSGSALMKHPLLVKNIISAVRKSIKIPLTVKIRSGWDDNSINALEIAEIAESEGVDAIIVHGRTREQMYSGLADLDVISEVKQGVSIPVIGNGDIYSPRDAVSMIDYTKCDGVMIGRGILGRPWAISQISEVINNKDNNSEISTGFKKEIVLKHYNEILNYYGIRNGVKIARKHICWYSKNIQNATEFRQKFNTINDLDEALKMINEFF